MSHRYGGSCPLATSPRHEPSGSPSDVGFAGFRGTRCDRSSRGTIHFRRSASPFRARAGGASADDAGFVLLAPFSRWRVGVGPVAAASLRPVSHDAGDYGGMVIVRRATEAMAMLVSCLEAELIRAHAVLTFPRLAIDSASL